MGGSVFGLHRREQIAFSGKFGVARVGRLRVRLRHSRIMRFCETCAKLGEAETCWDRTGASGSQLLWSYGNRWKPAGTYIDPEGQAYVKDQTYD